MSNLAPGVRQSDLDDPHCQRCGRANMADPAALVDELERCYPLAHEEAEQEDALDDLGERWDGLA